MKSTLCFSLLTKYQQKFFFFFNDFKRGHFADSVFVRKMLSNFDCQIFDSESVITDVGKKFSCVYFNYKNGCRVVNPFLGLNITIFPEESFFGDY